MNGFDRESFTALLNTPILDCLDNMQWTHLDVLYRFTDRHPNVITVKDFLDEFPTFTMLWRTLGPGTGRYFCILCGRWYSFPQEYYKHEKTTEAYGTSYAMLQEYYSYCKSNT